VRLSVTAFVGRERWQTTVRVNLSEMARAHLATRGESGGGSPHFKNSD